MPLEWSQSLAELKSRLGTEVVGRWIAPLKILSCSETALVFEAPNEFFRNWVATHYLDLLKEGARGRSVSIVTGVGAEAALPSGASGGPPSRVGRLLEPVARAAAAQTPGPAETALNPKFTFDRFVVGPSNRFAHAASLAVAESPAKAYNPLFIYGGVGLGKTHLMQAIGQAIAGRLPAARVFYTSSEQFMNELIASIQTKTTAKFRDRYRTVSALLIDDIQFIAGREATQEEFFHTFNTLYDAHRQIVLSSDRPPKDIAGLEERLISRFEWGLVTDIQAPDLETRIAILRKKAEEAGIAIPDELTDFIARQITTNIRELEGALIRVIAYCRFFSKPLSLATAHEVLKNMVREVGSRVTVGLIQNRVSNYFKISMDELRSARRQRSVLYPRQLAMYFCRKLTDSSLPEIGRAFGGKNHTTVLHAIGKIEQEIAQDMDKKTLIDQLLKFITTTTTPNN